MNVLIACEFSGAVRDAFRRRGHEAWSADLHGVEPEGEFPNYHLEGDCLLWLDGTQGPCSRWDLLLAHPPCTHLAVSGARWWKDKDPKLQLDAVEFVRKLLAAPIAKKAIENPIGALSRAIRKPDQVVHPWWFGVPEAKATCLWLENLPLLVPTQIMYKYNTTIHRMPPGPDRGKDRSRTFPGFANAMAEQWG